MIARIGRNKNVKAFIYIVYKLHRYASVAIAIAIAYSYSALYFPTMNSYAG